ncbi:MAG: hypothetical protein Q4G13_02690 [Moraxella sp.]|nr:hypothetical protein [Moraxella sp.]
MTTYATHLELEFATPIAHRHFAVIDSTNTQLIADIERNILECDRHHLYTADTQNKGRGQHGRVWVSGAGNVFLSLYVPIGSHVDGSHVSGSHANHHLHAKQSNLPVLAKLSGLLSLVVGLSLYRMPIMTRLNEYRSQLNLPKVGVKWANDLGYYDEQLGKFQKLIGILIEPVFKRVNGKSAMVGVVIGVGLNVMSSPVITDGLYHAVSVQDLLSCTKMHGATDWADNPTSSPQIKTTSNTHANSISATTSGLDDGSFLKKVLLPQQWYAPISTAILHAIHQHNLLTDTERLQAFVSEFHQAHVLSDRWVKIFLQDDRQSVHAQGICTGISTDGALLLMNDGVERAIFAGLAQMG